MSGHHRSEAAKRAGLAEVPCWVRDDLTEDEAFMFLVTDNNQGELSPLEIGLHALESVQLGNRWSQNGGMKEYAEAVGKAPSSITEYKNAAAVYSHVENDESVKFARANLIKAARHLNEIHKAPATLWPILVSTLLSKEWSVKDTKHFVGKVLEFEVPGKWQAVFFISWREVQQSYICTSFCCADIWTRYSSAHGGANMKKPRIPCTRCGSEDTLKTAGPYNVSATLIQQRYQCEACGQRFLASWECVGIRPYEARTTAELLQAGA